MTQDEEPVIPLLLVQMLLTTPKVREVGMRESPLQI